MNEYWQIPPSPETTTSSSTSSGWINEDTDVMTMLEDIGYKLSSKLKEKFRTPIKNWRKKIEGLK